jgi:hypothetical protein
MDLDDGVIQIDAHRPVDPGQQRGACLQSRQEPGCDGVELADMPERELPQERPERRGCVRAVEHGAHRAVAQQRHVIDTVGPGDHARDQRGDFRPCVGSLVGRHREVLISQCGQGALLGQGGHRNQPGARHQIGVIEAR